MAQKKIKDFITPHPERVALIQARVDVTLKDQVVAKMKKDGIRTMRELIEAAFKIYLTERSTK